MRISKISIVNMAAFLGFETALPAVAILQGKNGKGKSSFLNCVKYAFGKGHDDDIVHGSAQEGEILIEFDDGSAIKCQASREKHKTVRSWRAAGSKRFLVTREQIDAIANALSYDPLAFMDKDEDEQLRILLRIMPLECSDQEIAEAGGVQINEVPQGGNALDRINKLHKQLYDARRDLNVSADGQEKHAAELKKTLPPEGENGGNWAEEVRRLEAEQLTLQAEESKKMNDITAIVNEAKANAHKVYEDAVQAAAKIRDEAIENARNEGNAAVAQLRAQLKPRVEKNLTELATARERDRAAAVAEGTRKSVQEAEASAKVKREESASLTKALERLDKLKETVAGRLKGFTILNGRIVDANKVPFSKWNTESKIRLCLRIAVMAHGEAGFIVIDNAEHLDSEKYTGLLTTAEKYAEKDGLQFLIASVSDAPELAITSANELTTKEA